jgi:hypothetical protein
MKSAFASDNFPAGSGLDPGLRPAHQPRQLRICKPGQRGVAADHPLCPQRGSGGKGASVAKRKIVVE